MHELGLTDAMVKMIDKILAEEEMSGASKVVVEIGELSGVVPRFFEECWEAVTDGTRYQETALEIQIVPGMARCMDCGEQFRAVQHDLVCPKCRGGKLLPLSGRDMTIREIEAY